VVAMLEFFEIIYMMKIFKGPAKPLANEPINSEQMFFVPNLLSPFDATRGEHSALQYWQSMETKYPPQ
jgi:hypothetical protein